MKDNHGSSFTAVAELATEIGDSFVVASRLNNSSLGSSGDINKIGRSLVLPEKMVILAVDSRAHNKR